MSLTPEQLASIEIKRQAALERKRKFAQDSNPSVDPPQTCAGQWPVSLSPDQQASVDVNRQAALERKRKFAQDSNPSVDSPQTCAGQWSLSPDQQASVDVNRQAALERKRKFAQDSNPSVDSPQSFTKLVKTRPVLTAEQAAKVEANRRQALERRKAREQTNAHAGIDACAENTQPNVECSGQPTRDCAKKSQASLPETSSSEHEPGLDQECCSACSLPFPRNLFAWFDSSGGDRKAVCHDCTGCAYIDGSIVDLEQGDADHQVITIEDNHASDHSPSELDDDAANRVITIEDNHASDTSRSELDDERRYMAYMKLIKLEGAKVLRALLIQRWTQVRDQRKDEFSVRMDINAHMPERSRHGGAGLDNIIREPLEKWDVTLLSHVIFHVQPHRGSSEKLVDRNSTVGKAVYNLKAARNALAHDVTVRMSEKEFAASSSRICAALTHIEASCSAPSCSESARPTGSPAALLSWLMR